MKFFSNRLGVPYHGNDITGSFLYQYDLLNTQQVQEILEHGRPCVILNDCMTLDSTLPSDITGVFLPILVAFNARKWQNEYKFGIPCITNNAFCFIANKKTLNRSLCIKIIEILGLENFAYTWSGMGRDTDMSMILQELNELGPNSPVTQQQRNELLAPICMDAFVLGNIQYQDNVRFATDGHKESWQQGLDDIFYKSAVALITESFVGQPEAVFTEKTVYAALGNNFPIWVGGYGQAEHWQSFGFDIFDDVIDHSYQYRDTLIERCWYAIWLNLDLLNDLDKAKKLREIHWKRLNSNREKILTGQLDSYNQQKADNMPGSYRHHVQRVIDFFLKP